MANPIPRIGRIWVPCGIALMFMAVGGATRPAWAAPAFGASYALSQPDGSTVSVRIWGDEYYQIVESADGYTLVRDPSTGYICYARLAAGHLVSTGVTADAKASLPKGVTHHLREDADLVASTVTAARIAFGPSHVLRSRPNPEEKGPRPPNTGTTHGICLIVDFSDSVATIPRDSVADFCNLPGYTGYGNNGSVRDYFYDVSDGHLTYLNYVPPTYYRAAHPKSYYDNPVNSCEVGGQALVTEALNWLENTVGFDFSQYDANGDGIIDAINLLYAGAVSSGWSKGLWPHSSSVTFSADGVAADSYQISDMPGALELGTFCHENGHMLCWWPDLYDTTFASEGLGRYCLMSSGASYNPVEPCCYLQDIAGWGTTTIVTTPERGLSLTAGLNAFYRFSHPTLANEYYMVSNLQRTGRGATLPASGLAIWHIDTSGSNDFHQMTPTAHFEVTLVQADGLWNLEHNTNAGDANDLFSASGNSHCGPSTTPNTNWWSGAASGLDFNTVSASGAVMTFNFGNPDVLEVRPLAIGALAGPLGGPFSPASASMSVTNAAGAPQTWSVSADVGWLTLSKSGGTLAAGATDAIDATPNTAAMALGAGDHVATVTVTNVTSGRSQTRAITLSIRETTSIVWDTVSSRQRVSVPFGVTLTARDALGNVTPGFAGPVALSAFTQRMQTTATGAAGWGYPLKTFSQDARTQVIYLASELGGAGRISSLALYVVTAPARTPANWTIRMKHTALTRFTTAAWESTGWTTVCQEAPSLTATGWVTFALDTPFEYDGTSNLMVDFSFDDSSYSDFDGQCRYTAPGGLRSLYLESDSAYGDPLTWAGQSPLGTLSQRVPDLRFMFETSVALTPTTASGFVNGVWSGQVTLGTVVSGVRLRADAGNGHRGDSNTFSVESETLPQAPMTLSWTILGGVGLLAAGGWRLLRRRDNTLRNVR